MSSGLSAQELQKGNMFIWDDFSKGLNTKNSAFTLQKSEATIAENIRFDTEQKSFSKRDKTVSYGTADASNPILGMHRFYMNDGTKLLLVNHSDSVSKGTDSTGAFAEILDLTTGDRKAQWETWHNLAIGTDGYNQPYKYDGTSDSATYLGAPLATDAGSGAGPDGVYSYKVLCYTATYDFSFDTPSNTITVVDNDIDLTMIPICPDTYLGEDVTGRKIYRTGAGDSTYVLLSNGDIANNTAVTLTDSDADGARSGAYSPTLTAAPPKGKLILIHSNRLWILNNPDNPSRAYYSDDGSHEYFPSINYLDIRKSDGDEITFAKTILGKLTVGKNNTVQKIYTEGTPTDDWEISDPFSVVGCHAMYSAVNTPLGVVYLSNNGLYIFNGQYSTMISNQITPEIRDINPSNFVNVWGEYYKNAYYMTYTSSKSGASANNRILVIDLINNAYSIDLFSVNVLKNFKSGTDIEALYSGSSSDGTVYAHTDTVKELVHKIHSDFTGTFDDMRYIPTTVGGLAESPILELAWDVTIDTVTIDTVGYATIDAMHGVVDRPAIGGSYTSQILNLNASTYDKLYWNESIPSAGGNVRFRLRADATSDGVSAATWSSYVSDPSGSDISSLTAAAYAQYYISMDTTEIAYTPTVSRSGNYVVRLTYNTVGTTAETTIPLHYQSGWFDFGIPGYKKTIRKIYAYYDSDETGTLDIKLETLAGDEDTFEIDLQAYPTQYVNYTTSGALVGEFFRLDIQETSLNALKFKRLVIYYDVEPLI